jgi:hypothetical protein
MPYIWSQVCFMLMGCRQVCCAALVNAWGRHCDQHPQVPAGGWLAGSGLHARGRAALHDVACVAPPCMCAGRLPCLHRQLCCSAPHGSGASRARPGGVTCPGGAAAGLRPKQGTRTQKRLPPLGIKRHAVRLRPWLSGSFLLLSPARRSRSGCWSGWQATGQRWPPRAPEPFWWRQPTCRRYVAVLDACLAPPVGPDCRFVCVLALSCTVLGRQGGHCQRSCSC